MKQYIYCGSIAFLIVFLATCNTTSTVSLPSVTVAPEITRPEYIQTLLQGCQPQGLESLQASYQFQLIGQDTTEIWTVNVANQTCTIADGQVASPDVTIGMSISDLTELSQGTLNITQAYQQGKIEVSGASDLVNKMPDIFSTWMETSPATPLPTSEPILSAEPTPTLEPTPTPQLSPGYADLAQWVRTNARYLNGIALTEAAELTDRQKIRPQAPPTEVAAHVGPLNEIVPAYQTAWSQWAIAHYELEGPARQAPFEVIVHDVIQHEYRGAAYEIEVITWDAYPDFPVPANIYRPLNALQKRLPAIIVPLGCQTDLATHNDLNSEQRRGANLALRGFLVFTIGTGLCFDGLVGEKLENSFAFEQYGRMSGSGFTTRSIDLLMLIRVLDYLATRPDVDMERIGTTGYSYGGGMAYYLAIHDPRIAALGLVATGITSGIQIDQRFYNYRRHSSMYSGSVDIFLTSGQAPALFPDKNLSLPNFPIVPSPWQDLNQLLLLAPRPFYFVLGRDDPGTSITASQIQLDLLAKLYANLDPNALPPQLTAVEGNHNYNAERRRLIEDWFAKVLATQAIIPPPNDQFEHETPLLERAVLERIPPDFGKVTVHDIHAAQAMATITEQRARQPFNKREPENARNLLHNLLMLPGDDEERDGRPIMLDERNFTVADVSVSGQFWLLPLTHRMKAAGLTITPEKQQVKEVALYIFPHDVLIPPEEDLIANLMAGQVVVVVYLPGFGPLRSTQEKTGMLAVAMPTKMGRTLLGVGVEATQAGLDLITMFYPTAKVVGYSEGVDAGNVLAFTTAWDERVDEAHLHHAIDTFLDFLTAPTHPIPAPTMAIPGLAAYVDIPDLQAFAGQHRIIIESESTLSEYVLDIRPCFPNCD